MELNRVHTVYMIGIGGIGMSALARWFRSHGRTVSGYDKTATPLTDKLQEEGIAIHFEENLELVDSEVFTNSEHSIIIYTPAIPAKHKELTFFKENDYALFKRSEVLGAITKEHFTIAVAGTHGKTTTCSMIAHLLKSAGKNVTAFVGGIMSNYDSNLILSGSSESEPELIVVEADEFDRSFLQLYPNILVITSVDPDHLDIYGSEEELRKNFKELIDRVDQEGNKILQKSVVEKLAIEEGVDQYALIGSEIHTENLNIKDGAFCFDYVADSQTTAAIRNLLLPLPGNHNVENAIGAITASQLVGLDESNIRIGLSTYLGVKRRFEFLIRRDDIVLIDDYAHHPQEIESFLDGVKQLYPDKSITAIFQPHLFSRTRDFHPGFGKSLSKANRVILLDVYPARELSIEGVTSQLVLDSISHARKSLVTKAELKDELLKEINEVVCMIGAGDIDQLVETIKKALENELVKA